MSNILKATHEGKILIGEIEIPCAVLEDGQRIISKSAVFKAFGRSKRGRNIGEVRVPNMPAFLDANNLQPFVGDSLKGVLNQIDFLEKNGKTESSGYSALILPMMCKVYLDARQDKVLKPQQLPLARASEVLLLGLADLGIIALVDEATGYQYERENDELQTILKAYISKDLLPWQKRFPDNFYKEIFRLNGWNYTVQDIKQRPGVVGTWTKKLIYEQLPKGILKELEKNTPKNEDGKYKAKLHQSLTPDIGNPHLQSQIYSIIGVMNISDDWKSFIRNFNKMVARKQGVVELPLKFEDLEYKEVPKEKKTIDNFSLNLMGLLNTPPPKKNK